ncbi:MAG: ParB/RepB/Spo0J family partition protein [Treponema sp.]|nr:ParB/RepB/Spo0J family partition protein [Candidatus Treponema caballi]
MPKLQTASNIAINIPLSQIAETGNVRTEYAGKEITELAESIKLNGLLNPITVRKLENPIVSENGVAEYELIAGHRRLRAYKWLISQGQNYTYIPACVHQGDKHRLQLIENIQRENLTPAELEAGVKQMQEAGLTQSDIAKQLGKSIQWVSDISAGIAVRERIEQIAPEANVSDVSTKTLSQLRSVPEDKLPEALEDMAQNGNTYRAATAAAKKVKKPSAPKKVKPLMLSIQTVVDMIQDYQRRTTDRLQASEKDSDIQELCYKVAACTDLISLFEAYQHE